MNIGDLGEESSAKHWVVLASLMLSASFSNISNGGGGGGEGGGVLPRSPSTPITGGKCFGEVATNASSSV